MTTIPVITAPLPTDAAGKVKRNAQIALKSLSSYVVLAASALAAVWLNMSEAQQAALIASHPVLHAVAPYLAAVTWLAAKLAPQNIVLPADKEAERKWLISRITELESAFETGFADTHIDVTAPGFVPEPAPVPVIVPAPAPSPEPVTATHPEIASAGQAARLGNLWPSLRVLMPDKSDSEILAAVLTNAPKPEVPAAVSALVSGAIAP